MGRGLAALEEVATEVLQRRVDARRDPRLVEQLGAERVEHDRARDRRPDLEPVRLEEEPVGRTRPFEIEVEVAVGAAQRPGSQGEAHDPSLTRGPRAAEAIWRPRRSGVRLPSAMTDPDAISAAVAAPTLVEAAGPACGQAATPARTGAAEACWSSSS